MPCGRRPDITTRLEALRGRRADRRGRIELVDSRGRTPHRLVYIIGWVFMTVRSHSVQVPQADAHRRYHSLGAFMLESGVALPDAKIAYATFGTLNSDKSNVILAPSWFGSDHHGYDFLDRRRPRPRSREVLHRFDRDVLERLQFVAEQHARPISRSAFPGDSDSRQCRSGSACAREFRGNPCPCRRRLLNGRPAGVPVGREPSRIRRADCRLLRNGQDCTRTVPCVSRAASPHSPRMPRSRMGITPSHRRRGWPRGACTGPVGCIRRSGGAGNSTSRDDGAGRESGHCRCVRSRRQ